MVATTARDMPSASAVAECDWDELTSAVGLGIAVVDMMEGK